jgi:uncharacterized protein (DUF4415 family)
LVSKWPKYETTEEEEARIQAGIDADPDNPELTPDEIARAKPFAEVFPDLAAAIRRARGRPPEPLPKKQVTVRLDADVIDRLKADGAGWQTRMNATLREGLGLTDSGKRPKQKRA